jgi:hypothetical protein
MESVPLYPVSVLQMAPMDFLLLSQFVSVGKPSTRFTKIWILLSTKHIHSNDSFNAFRPRQILCGSRFLRCNRFNIPSPLANLLRMIIISVKV